MNLQDLGNVCPEIILYRAIHLLVQLYNDVIGSLLFLFLLASGTVQVMSAVTAILQAWSISIFLVIFFSMTVIQATLIIMVAYGFTGNFHRASFFP